MYRVLAAAAAVAFGAAAGSADALRAADQPPPWAYGFDAPPDNTKLYTLYGSRFSFTPAQITSRYAPADWFPEDHPAMPQIVAHGREVAQPTIWACGLCHYPNGKGRPENANLTGLSYEYFVQQLIDFRNGRRRTSDQRKGNTDLMAGFAQAMTDEEITVSAKYFTSIPATPWITVMERETVPKTKAVGGMLLTREGTEADVEPIGDRIIETPINARETDFLRNPRSGFIAYVPPGSLKRGEALVMNGVTASGDSVIARNLPWSRAARIGPNSHPRRAFAKLSRATTLRHAARQSEWCVDSSDGASACQSRPGRSVGSGGICGIAEAVENPSCRPTPTRSRSAAAPMPRAA